MPEYGIGYNPPDPDKNFYESFSKACTAAREWEQAATLKEQARCLKEEAAQDATIDTQKSIAALLARFEASSKDISRMASAAEKRAEAAERESEAAKSDAQRSRHQSRIANILAGIAIVIAILSWLIPRDAAVGILASIIS